MRKFYVIVEVSPSWKGDKYDMATWIDCSLSETAKTCEHCSPSKTCEPDVTVYDNLTDLLADNALDAMAQVSGDEP